MIFALGEYLSMSRDVFSSHNWEEGVGYYQLLVGGIQGRHYPPIVQRTPPTTTTTKKPLVQNINSATIKKPCS